MSSIYMTVYTSMAHVHVYTSKGWLLEVALDTVAVVEVTAVDPIHIIRMVLIPDNGLQVRCTCTLCMHV